MRAYGWRYGSIGCGWRLTGQLPDQLVDALARRMQACQRHLARDPRGADTGGPLAQHGAGIADLDHEIVGRLSHRERVARHSVGSGCVDGHFCYLAGIVESGSDN